MKPLKRTGSPIKLQETPTYSAKQCQSIDKSTMKIIKSYYNNK
jgi:hypothetical protein